VVYNQGDQIGRIFAYWAVVIFSPIFSMVKVVLIFQIMDWGIFGRFLTSSSGHPVYASAEKNS
jgi:hypothetical protein